MCKPLGQYHAMSYALHILNSKLLNTLRSRIRSLPFINDQDPLDIKNNFYRVLYRVAFDRFYDFYDRKIKSNIDDIELANNLQKLKDKYFDEPTRLLEYLRTEIDKNEEDKKFGVILHGDFNRNNVLFCQNGDNDVTAKMIDFQELRYATPAFDLSFFMYMNTSEDIREAVWMKILKTYHEHLFKHLSRIVGESNSNLDNYKYIFKYYNINVIIIKNYFSVLKIFMHTLNVMHFMVF